MVASFVLRSFVGLTHYFCMENPNFWKLNHQVFAVHTFGRSNHDRCACKITILACEIPEITFSSLKTPFLQVKSPVSIQNHNFPYKITIFHTKSQFSIQNHNFPYKITIFHTKSQFSIQNHHVWWLNYQIFHRVFRAVTWPRPGRPGGRQWCRQGRRPDGDTAVFDSGK